MQMHAVCSSNISSIGYENNTLHICFNNGRVYAYKGVPQNLFNNLINASSKGQYFDSFIKNSFPSFRIR